jgi:hypothetical protein
MENIASLILVDSIREDLFLKTCIFKGAFSILVILCERKEIERNKVK